MEDTKNTKKITDLKEAMQEAIYIAETWWKDSNDYFIGGCKKITETLKEGISKAKTTSDLISAMEDVIYIANLWMENADGYNWSGCKTIIKTLKEAISKVNKG